MISSVTTPSVGAILSRSPARLPEGWRSIVGVGVSPVGYVLGRAANAVASFVGKAWRKVDVPKQAEAAKRAEAARPADAPRPAAAVPRDLPPTYAEFAKSQSMLDAFQSFMATSITDEHGQFMLNAQAFLRHASGKSATPDSIRTFFKDLYAKHLTPDASLGLSSESRQVNVADTTFQKFRDLFNRLDEATVEELTTAIAAAQEEVYQFVKGDVGSRFLHSEGCREAQLRETAP